MAAGKMMAAKGEGVYWQKTERALFNHLPRVSIGRRRL